MITDLLAVYVVVLALELVLSLAMFLIIMLVLPRGRDLDKRQILVARTRPSSERFPEDLAASLQVAFQELSRGSGDVALLVHTRTLLQRNERKEPDCE